MSAIPRIGRLEAPAYVAVDDVLDPRALLAAVDARTRSLVARSRSERRGMVVRRALGLADLAGLALAFLLARLLSGEAPLALDTELLVFGATLPAWLLVAHLHGLYDRDERYADNATADDVVGVFHLVTVGAWSLLAASLLLGSGHPQLEKLVVFWALAICLVPVARTVARGACRRSSAYVQNTLILGAGDVGQLIARKLIRHPEYGLNVVGFVDSLPKVRREDLPEHLTILGPQDRLHDIIEALDVERVVVSFSNASATETLELVRALHDVDVQVDLVPRLFDLVGPRAGIHSVEGMPLVGLPPTRMTAPARLVKRGIDLVGAALMLAAVAPLFAWIAWRVHRDSPGPIFFRQTRVGVGRREFTALKFRTMKQDTDTSVHQEYIRRTAAAGASAGASGLFKLSREDAITPFGHWLRKTSLDELPQLINVLRGDMSLVGPRPCIPYEVEHFQPHHFERFLVPQGLTGLWQVTARAHSSFGEALDMDVAYARGWSLGLDLRLVMRTPLQLLRQRGATA